MLSPAKQAAGEPLRVLIVEDSEDDARLVLRELRKSGYEPASERVDSEAAMRAALADKAWALILSDYMIPGFGGLEALRIARECAPGLPFILVSNKVGEETLVDAMRAGAMDFVMKDRLSRLGPIVKRELADAAMRQAIERAQIEWKSAFDAVQDAIFIHDTEFRIVRANLAYAALGGLSVQEVIGKRYWEIFPKTGGSLSGRATARTSGEPTAREIKLPSGETYLSRSFPVADAKGSNVYSLHVLQDITERNRVQEALEKSERHYRKLIEDGSDVFFIIDRSANLIYRSESGKRVTGWDTEELRGKPLTKYVSPEYLPAARNAIAEMLRDPEKIAHAELRVQRKDGSLVDLEVSGRNLLDDPDIGGLLVTAHDVTERKRAQQAELEQLKLAETFFNHSVGGLVILDRNFNFIRVNEAYARSCRREIGEFAGRNHFEMYPSDTQAIFEEVVRTKRSHVTFTRAFVFPDQPDRGTTYWDWTLVPILDEAGEVEYLVFSLNEVTERKRAEEALVRANRALRTLSACNEALVRAGSESELLDSICRLIVETGGYRMAWVGFPEQDPAKTVRPAARYGHDEGYLESAKISWGDTERGRGPTGTVIRTGAVQVNQNFLSNPHLAIWREAAQQRGYQSTISLPLKISAGAIGVLTIYAPEPDAFGKDELRLLEELANDLTFGIETLRTRADRDRIAREHRRHEEILRESLEESIKAIADTVEMRDPYTAGHQRRVGELAVALSRELGLPEATIHGIGLAASVHDLGKISIPAEILAKPSKLTDVEFMLIKSHAQAGYNILKDIKFPWPIATMVWQHHERLDGTGYPQGLKGDQILLESRIMAVADVVEAMASHRPYRAGLGIDAALKEIEAGNGTRYDAQVAAACLRLFREKNYRIPD